MSHSIATKLPPPAITIRQAHESSQPATLTDAEQTRLVALEGIVERGQQTFIQVGQALLEIRDERLYRGEHKSFEDYCAARWGWSRGRAYQLMDAAKVVALVSTTVDAGPTNEAQARELVPLLRSEDAGEAIAAAWIEATHRANERERPLTAEIVREVVDTGRKPEPLTPQEQRNHERLLAKVASAEWFIDLRVALETLREAQHWADQADFTDRSPDHMGEVGQLVTEAEEIVLALRVAYDNARLSRVRYDKPFDLPVLPVAEKTALTKIIREAVGAYMRAESRIRTDLLTDHVLMLAREGHARGERVSHRALWDCIRKTGPGRGDGLSVAVGWRHAIRGWGWGWLLDDGLPTEPRDE